MQFIQVLRHNQITDETMSEYCKENSELVTPRLSCVHVGVFVATRAKHQSQQIFLIPPEMSLVFVIANATGTEQNAQMYGRNSNTDLGF